MKERGVSSSAVVTQALLPEEEAGAEVSLVVIVIYLAVTVEV